MQVRYMDPSYQVRSVPAIASDSIYCSNLGSSAVHGAMSGYTGNTNTKTITTNTNTNTNTTTTVSISISISVSSAVHSAMS